MQCKRCQAPLEVKGVGRKRQYCSSACRNATCRERNPELVKTWAQTSGDRLKQKTEEKHRQLPARFCEICHSTIAPRSVSKGAVVCSRQCGIKRNTAKRTPEQIRAIKQRQKARDPDALKDQAQKVRAKRTGRYKAPVFRAEIFKRDSYTCQLCKQPLEMMAEVPKHSRAACCESWCYLAPTIDHIIPLANGGWHEPRNVQAAHFICNSKKSNKSEKLTA